MIYGLQDFLTLPALKSSSLCLGLSFHKSLFLSNFLIKFMIDKSIKAPILLRNNFKGKRSCFEGQI